MATKLNRGKKNMFRRRRAKRIKTFVTVLVCLALVGAGVLLAKEFSGTPETRPEQGGASSSSSTTVPTTTTTTLPPPQAETPVPEEALRGAYIPVSLLSDTEALETKLAELALAGHNSVVFDLKDADGVVWYAAESVFVKKTGAVSANAVTKEALKAAAALCRTKGFEPVPRVFAFRDKTAPVELSDARIKLEGNGGVLWLDRKKAEGGKPWLNPCSETAWDYVLGFCAELKELGFSHQILEGVQFPEKDSRSDYGNSEWAQKEKNEVLSAFVEKAKTTVGDGLIVSMSGLAALGSNTAGYHGNPLTFGMQTAAPRLLAAELGESVSFNGETASPNTNTAEAVTVALNQLSSYSRIMNLSVELIPWVDTDEIAKAVIAQGIDSYVVYAAE